MSLYRTLFGENKDAVPLLGMIKMTRDSFDRYRDVYLNTQGTIIYVLTRCGGSNRTVCADRIEQIKQNKYYIKDYDDDFDNTYCTFEFKVPDKYLIATKKMAPKEPVLSIKEKFDKEIAESNIPGSDASQRMEAIAKQLLDGIEGNSGPFIFL